MATTQALIDFELDILNRALDGVLDLAEAGDEEPDTVRYHEMLVWNSDMSRLKLDLDPAYRRGQMTLEQQERYRVLLARLKDALPLIERLGFAKPQVSLEP